MKLNKRWVRRNVTGFLIAGAGFLMLGVRIVGHWPLIISTGFFLTLSLYSKYRNLKQARYERSGFVEDYEFMVKKSWTRMLSFTAGFILTEALLLTDLYSSLQTLLALSGAVITTVIAINIYQKMDGDARQLLAHAVGIGILMSLIEAFALPESSLPDSKTLLFVSLMLVTAANTGNSLKEQVWFCLPASLIFFIFAGWNSSWQQSLREGLLTLLAVAGFALVSNILVGKIRKT